MISRNRWYLQSFKMSFYFLIFSHFMFVQFEEFLFHTFFICVFSEHFEATTVFIFVEHGYHGYRCYSHLLEGGKSSVCSYIDTNTQCQHSDLQWYKRLTLVSEIQLLFWNTFLTFSVLLCGTRREMQKYLITEEKSRGDCGIGQVTKSI